MKNVLYLVAFACAMFAPLVGCHSSRHAVSHKNPKPRFIDGVYIAGHNQNSTTENAIDPRHPPVKSKTGARAHPPAKTTLPPENQVNVTTGKVDKLSPPATVKAKYAQILSVSPKEITNYALYQFIEKWYGTDYRLGGKNKAGIDCSGFAQRLYAEVYGIDLLRTSVEQFANCKRIKHKKDAEEGDLVFFRIHSKHITHVGVYLANSYFVHASTTGGVMISNLNEEYWTKYYAGCGRVIKG